MPNIDPSLKIVAVAETKTIGRKKIETLFFNKKVVVHYPKGDCATDEMRKLHRGFLLAINKLKVVEKCAKCWTTRTWNNALASRERIKLLTKEQILKDIENL